MAAELVHATGLALAGRAALIRGPSGAGKSDLALRCLALAPTPLLPDQAELISDDQVQLERRGGDLYASAPETITGLLEIRGVGVQRIPAARAHTRVTLAVDLVGEHEPAPERYPDPWPHTACLGISLPLLRLRPFEASAAIKLLLALRNGPAGRGP